MSKGVNVRLGLAAALGLLLQPASLTAQPAIGPVACDPALTRLFTPLHPQLGRYEVCTTPTPLRTLAGHGWTIEAPVPADAFGTSGLYDRAALARVYGGVRPTVARGWFQGDDGAFESLTLISPYPDASLAHLEPGTLVIRFIICCP